MRQTSLPLIVRGQSYGTRTSVVDVQGSFTYDDLLQASSRVATGLLAGRDDLKEERVAFLVTPGLGNTRRRSRYLSLRSGKGVVSTNANPCWLYPVCALV
jgi:hypothetical protein